MPSLKPSSRSLALIASILVLSLSAGYIALAWTEPTGTMPVTVAAPLNTGTSAQTKSGALAITGNLTAPMIYDADNTAYFLNPAGQTLLAGPVGIGTASPSSGSKFHILQSSYGYQDSVIESALPSVRLVDNENGQSSFGFLADGSNLYLDAYTYANRFTNSYGSHILTVQSDGKVTINNGGQLCIGTNCVASSTWATMVNNASGGGGNTFTAVPTTIFSDGFEDGTLAPFTTANNCGAWANVSCAGVWTVTSAEKYNGNYSAYSGTTVCSSCGTTNINMDLPGTYSIGPGGGTISFMAKGNPGTSGSLSVLNNGGSGVLTKIAGSGINNIWQKFTYYLAEGAYSFRFNFAYCYGCWGDSGVGAWIDDVIIQQSQSAVTINGNITLNGSLINVAPINCYQQSQVYQGSGNYVLECQDGFYLKKLLMGTGGVVGGAFCCKP